MLSRGSANWASNYWQDSNEPEYKTYAEPKSYKLARQSQIKRRG
jgi:hypothetical protein